MVLGFYGSMIALLWFYDFMVLWFYGSMILWLQLLIAGCYVNSLVIVCGIFGDLCESSVIYVNSFGWSSVEFSWLYVYLPWSMWILLGDRLWNFLWLCVNLPWSMWILLGDRLWNFLWLCVNLPWSMWILLGDRLWNFLGSVWISLICVNSFGWSSVEFSGICVNFPDLCEF